MVRHLLFRYPLYGLLAFALVSPAPVEQAVAKVTIKGVEEIVFTEVEKRLIKEFFAMKAVKVKKGKRAKKGKPMPPGIAKRGLPAELESRLPKGRPGTVRQIVDGDVVLIDEATGKVLDALVDVIE